MELRDLEKRIQEIEDMEAIKKVVAKYLFGCGYFLSEIHQQW